jgi:hypothetical protein
LTAQTTEFTEELRSVEKHPALASRAAVRPMHMWVFQGELDGISKKHTETTLCPPGDKRLQGTGWPHAAAVMHRGYRKDGDWDGEPEMIGYITAHEARFMAKVLTDFDGPQAIDGPLLGPSVTEVPSE